jgi:hypothetical protein
MWRTLLGGVAFVKYDHQPRAEARAVRDVQHPGSDQRRKAVQKPCSGELARRRDRILLIIKYLMVGRLGTAFSIKLGAFVVF